MTHWPKATKKNITEPPLVAQNNKEMWGIEKQKTFVDIPKIFLTIVGWWYFKIGMGTI